MGDLPKLTVSDIREIQRLFEQQKPVYSDQDIADMINRRLELRIEDQKLVARIKLRPNCF